MRPVVLASASAARAAMLRAAGVVFEARPAAIDEAAIAAGIEAGGASPRDLAVALAEAKAAGVRAPEALVIGADQTLDLNGACLHKAVDLAAARHTLETLRGRTHALHSAVAVARGGGVVWRHVDTARLTMRWFSDAFIDAFIARHGHSLLTSVGGYRLEDDGVQLFSEVAGDYFTILGLPLIALLEVLRDEGALVR